MAQQTINIGTASDDGTGDTARDAFDKTNDNFDELYNEIFNVADQTVDVYTLSDLPTAVGDVITLNPSTVYLFRASISFGATRVVMSSNTVMRGAGSLAIVLTYTGSGDFITAPDVACAVAELTISAQTTGARVVDYSTTTLRIFRMDDCTIVCDRFADFSGTSWAARLTNVSIFPFTTGAIACSGTCRSFNYDTAGIIPTSGIIFDLGTCVFDSLVINTIVYNLPSGSTFLSGLANNGNISSAGRGLVINCQGANTGGAELSGVSVGDARWKFQNNTPIADTRNDYLIYFDAAATTTINTAGTYELISGTFTEDHANGFITTAAGRVTWDGVEDMDFPLDIAVSAEPVSGVNKDVAIKVAINGVVEGPELAARIDSGNPQNINIPWQVTLSNGDYVEAYITNITDTVDIQVNAIIFRGN